MPPSRAPKPQHADRPALPRRLRWMQPLLALAGLGSLPAAAPAHTLDAVPAITRVQDLRARLLARDAAALQPTGQVPAASRPLPDSLVAQWQKWNDWQNWAKWGKQ